MKHKGIVKEIGNGVAIVSLLKEEACSSCSGRKFCGTAQRVDVKVKNSIDAEIGDTVEVETASEKAFGFAALVFLAPVLLAVALYLVFLTVDQFLASITAFLGFIIPFVVAYLLDKKKKDSGLPEITALICPESETQPCK
jgi:positive regulator of sigma E activity